jgi:hypothetical protein
LNLEIIGRINEQIVKRSIESKQEGQESQGQGQEEEKEKEKEEEPPNQGKLLLDATVAPADIRYPTDINLLNQARVVTEKIVDSTKCCVADQTLTI